MNRHRAFNLIFVAIFALSAVIASAAQAAPEYKAEHSPAFVHGESVSAVFTITHGPENLVVKCATATVSGEFVGTSVKTVTVHPEYTGCELNEIPAKVETKRCNYRLNQPTLISSGTWTITASLLSCPATEPITIKTTGCTVEVSESGNSTLSHVILKNTSSGGTRSINAFSTLGAITAKQSSGCPGGAGTFTTADYSDVMTLFGFTNATYTTQQGFWVE